ncbi:DUF2157 domain-containing protein [Saliterribacillus persicus]|uniref:Putative membrane protein n=1 Tax=Saliterribacillus persicus TaxID=930114 RepID=A0A368XPC0_9BACI|nr:DUF2157 domain-containing protein [Saliterribacillus persicus]RCW69705.1 putative membrane protein [Saliterribacillus persicus]
MNRNQLQNEVNDWVEEEIISAQQAEKILAKYPAQNRSYLLIMFASLFIGLGFLTFIASNLQSLPDMVNMAIILVFMVGYYLAGEWVYRKRSEMLGIGLLIIGLLIFGAGIFLTGQMYHYSYYQAFPFIIWSIAAFLLFMIYKRVPLYVVAITILTIGQFYQFMTYHTFNLWLFALLLIGFSHYTYHYANKLYSYLFALSLIVQSLMLVFVNSYDYYWLIVLFLIVYIISEVVGKRAIEEPFKWLALLSIFIVTCIETFFISEIINFVEKNWLFFFVWLFIFSIAILIKYFKKQIYTYTQLVLFIPILFAGEWADVLSMIALFVFSLGLLFHGYRIEDNETISYGTLAFLISTFIAYIHLAWAFLDKSLFFFIGGIILFTLSYFLEKKRRRLKADNSEGVEK